MIPTRVAILSAMASLAAIALTVIDGGDSALAGPGHSVELSTAGSALTVEGGTHSGHHVHGRG